MNASPGVKFGRYRLVERLGAGGMAIVYRAVAEGPRGFKRELVVKRIRREYARDPHFVEMLVAEGRLSAALRHPGIVQVYELGEVDGEPYLAMELVDGVDLLRLIQACANRRERMPPAVSVHVVSELAAALAYAHALTDAEGRPLSIIHRDVTPSNVMVTPRGEVKLLDFGIAKAASHARDEQTRTGTLKGKLSYLSPEQADGRPIDARSDIFSLGIVLHEALVGRRLFRGATDLETLRLVREARVTPPSQEVPGLDPDLDAVVARMLARDPEERYARCEEVVEALRPVAHRLHADASAVRELLRVVGPIPKPPQQEDTLDAWERERLGETRSLIAPTTQVTRSSGELLPAEGAAQPSRRGVALAVGLAALAIIGGAFWLGVRTPPVGDVVAPAAAPPPVAPPPPAVPAPPATPPAPPPAAPAPPSAAPAPPALVSLRVRGPAGAEVLLDGKLVGTVPVTSSLVARAGERRLEVRLAGHQPWARAIAGDADVDVTATLQRRRTAAPARPKKRAPATSPIIRDPFQ